jgi:hypothetical protein
MLTTMSNGPFPVVKSFDCEKCQDTGTVLVKGWANVKCIPRGCPDCCPHDEIEHFMCIECDKEFEPSDFYNEDEGMDR